jgi:hypothetical protein
MDPKNPSLEFFVVKIDGGFKNASQSLWRHSFWKKEEFHHQTSPRCCENGTFTKVLMTR